MLSLLHKQCHFNQYNTCARRNLGVLLPLSGQSSSRDVLIRLFKVILAQSSMFWHLTTVRSSAVLLQFQDFKTDILAQYIL